jgi:ectoine hydroxylase-related dioxygenase (phytanoyl-CoA dioxygenase family)
MLPLPPPTRDLDVARTHLDDYGCALILDALTADELAQARQRIHEQAAAERRMQLNGAGPNQWVFNIVNKGEIFRQILLKPLTRTLIEHLLGPDSLLSSFTCHIMGKGGAGQALHRDGGAAPDEMPVPIVANIMWPMCDFTAANGGTRCVPGSHRYPTRPPRDQSGVQTLPLEAPAGSAFVFSGKLWHGAGENLTDEPRYGLLSYHCLGWVRQQENFALSLAPEVYEKCSPELLKLLGFTTTLGTGNVNATRHEPRGQVVRRPTEFITELS